MSVPENEINKTLATMMDNIVMYCILMLVLTCTICSEKHSAWFISCLNLCVYYQRIDESPNSRLST